MTRRRWIADEWREGHAALTGAHAEHLSRVLRARPGDEFDIAAGGRVWRGRVSRITPERVEFELAHELATAPGNNIAVAIAIFKFDRMEWAIEKLTELGASLIIPFSARRSDPHLVSAATRRIERWRRVVLAASEQSRRTSPPQISDLLNFRQVAAASAGLKIVASETAATDASLPCVLGSVLNSRGEVPASVTVESDIMIAIGPEGGWTAGELDLLKSAGWREASLGAAILRAETAAIAAVAVCAAWMANPP
ncbi:MAG: 16S rRNA (uracil(1498)-N(3))-methyltransferase [Acidobacteria bacterium]|nr:16S rRNA (uracil(1498)-N(3))-methyltransferase [Acidobacteriota bacterium]